MKVVINRCYGGFGLSGAALEFLNSDNDWYYRANRADPKLIECIETLGSCSAGARYSALKIIEIPDDVKWHIEEYDGMEWVAEDHRTWS